MARKRGPQNTPTDDAPVQDDVVQEEAVQTATVEPEAPKVNVRSREPKVPAKDTAPTKAPTDPFWLEPGDVISINMKQRSMIMFPLGNGDIFRLNHRLWHAEIPENTPEDWLKALMILLEQGDIVKGKKHMPKYPKNPKVLEKCKQYLELPVDQLIRKLKPLVIHKGLVEGYRSSEIIMSLMRYEQEHFHRKSYIDLLNEALEHIGGTGPITQTPVENLHADDLEEDFS